MYIFLAQKRVILAIFLQRKDQKAHLININQNNITLEAKLDIACYVTGISKKINSRK